MPYKDPEKQQEQRRRHYLAHKAEYIQRAERYRKAHPEWARARNKDYAQRNKDKSRKNAKRYYWRHVDEERLKALARYHARKGQITEEQRRRQKEYKEKWQKENQARIRQKSRDYYEANKERVTAATRLYDKERSKTDVSYRLRRILRNRIRIALRADIKRGSAVKDLGCTTAELKVHLEKLFQPGMTWDNWGAGKDKWHIDHIRPLASFDLTDREQFLQAVHYTNLQPLWQTENLRKSAKWSPP